MSTPVNTSSLLIDGTLKIVTDGGGIVTIEVPTATVGNDYGIQFFYPDAQFAGNVVQSTADGFATTEQPVVMFNDETAEKTIHGPINIHTDETENPETYILQLSHGLNKTIDQFGPTDPKFHIKERATGFEISYTGGLRISDYSLAGKPTWSDGSEFITDSVFPISVENGGTGSTTTAGAKQNLNVSYLDTTTVAVHTTLGTGDSGKIWRANTATQNIFFTLPAISTISEGYWATFIKINGSNTMRVRGNTTAGDFICGKVEHDFTQIYDSITVVAIGGRWYITQRVPGSLFV